MCILIGFCFVASVDFASAVQLDFDAKTCQKQMEALLRLDVDCLVEVRPGSEALSGVPQALQALVPGTSCRMPVKFRKAQIYGEWITGEQARSPDFPIACSISAGGPTAEFSAALRVECKRTAGNWSCSAILHDVKGLGVLGRQLENYVNNHRDLGMRLTKALME